MERPCGSIDFPAVCDLYIPRLANDGAAPLPLRTIGESDAGAAGDDRAPMALQKRGLQRRRRRPFVGQAPASQLVEEASLFGDRALSQLVHSGCAEAVEFAVLGRQVATKRES